MLIFQCGLIFCLLFDCFVSFFFKSHFSFFFYFHPLFAIVFFSKNGATPLFIAAQNGHEQIVDILLEKGKANVDLATKVLILFAAFFFLFSFSKSFFSLFLKDGTTPLFIAAFNGHYQVVQILLEKGGAIVDLQGKVYFHFVPFFFFDFYFYFL